MLLSIIFFSTGSFAQVSINTTGNPPDADAMLDVTASDKGVLIPRVSLANRPPSTKLGMIIYQTDGNAGFYYCNGVNWVKIGDASEHFFQANGIGSDIGYGAGNVYFGSTGDADGYRIYAQGYTYGKAAVRGTEQAGSSIYSEGNLGVLNWTGSLTNPMGLPVNLANIGVLGIKPPAGLSGSAVYGWADQAGSYGGIFVSDGPGSALNTGVYAVADSSTTTVAVEAVASGNITGTSYGVRTLVEGTSGFRYGVEAKAEGIGSTNYAINAFTDNGGTNIAGMFKGRVKVEGHNGATNASDSTYAYLLHSEVTHSQSQDTRAVYGESNPQPGYGYGILGQGGYMGVYGSNNGGDYAYSSYGIYGYASGSAGSRYGVYGYAYNSGGSNAYGVYGTASGATNNWAGYFSSGAVYIANDLRIGTTSGATGYKLSINGKVACEEVLVEDNGSWPDYVFKDDYSLLTIEELESEINDKGHLPGLPSAREVEQNGFELGDMQRRLLEKVEELTLYTIEQQKLINDLQEQVRELKEDKKRTSR